MTIGTAPAPLPADPRPSNRWALVPVGILSALLAGQALLFWLAVRDPGFAVEPDAWAQAVAYDDRLREETRARELGWRLRLRSAERGARVLEACLVSSGGPVAGAAFGLRAFPVAGGREEVRLHHDDAPGGCRPVPLSAARLGLWEFRWEAVHGADRLRGRVRGMLDASGFQEEGAAP